MQEFLCCWNYKTQETGMRYLGFTLVFSYAAFYQKKDARKHYNFGFGHIDYHPAGWVAT
jgi:hypothetical protein